MKTSKTIKATQYKPLPIISHDFVTNRTVVQGTNRNYTIIRDKSKFRCGCPATGLCRHIITVVDMYMEKAGFQTRQFWTNEEDAKRQKRSRRTLMANGKEFYVTFANQETDSDKVWNAPMPEVHGSKVLLQDGKFRIVTRNNGEAWQYCVVRGSSFSWFTRKSWTRNAMKEEFDAWWKTSVESRRIK